MGKQQRFYWFIVLIITLLLVSWACGLQVDSTPETPTPSPLPTSTFTPLPPAPVQPGETNPDEPVFISGEIPYTSPFFLNSIAEPFVMLEDQAGFVSRDPEFEFSLQGQVIGPVEITEDETLVYYLSLPAVPQGTLLDVDNNDQADTGVQIFAVAYWSNTWNDPFLETRDGTGWSNAYASTITDPDLDNEIQGGILVVWAPDENQAFPTGYGEDGLLFTDDDPTAPIPAGYNLVDLNREPFFTYKEASPYIILNEGVVAVNDFTEMGYAEAFQALFDKVSNEYAFTEDKQVDWPALYDRFAPRFESARNAAGFYQALREFSYQIPDGHIYVSLDNRAFYEESGGGFGLLLAELGDGRIIVTEALPGAPADLAGIQPGAEIVTWDDQPVLQAIAQVQPYFGPFSTSHARRIEQVNFLTRVPPDTSVRVRIKNPGETEEREFRLDAVVEYDSLFKAIPSFNRDELALPVEGYVLDESGLGYVRINTFSADYNMMARLWDYYLESLIENEVPGLIIDVRVNGGGSAGMALDFAGYFFDEEFVLHQRSYYNELTGQFEPNDLPVRVKPGPLLFEGPIAVLVSPNCVSACEGFAYSLQHGGRSLIVGHYPTAGAFGEVGRGQYELPDDFAMQFPTGRPETMDGKLLIEGVGVIPDLLVPVSEASALGQVDALLEAAVQALLDDLR